VLDFAELYETHAADVFRFALWLSGDRPTAEEITSETFVRAWGRRSAIRTATLRAYLITVARNTWLERRRTDSRHVPLEVDPPDPRPGAEESLDSKIRLRRVREFLQTEPEVDRSAFVLRVQHELPYAEIGRVLELSEGAVRVKVHRLRRRLARHCLEKERN
jgi:RNA polymerase sigma-70 factor (ECF subfamily)